jgi:hypothetical protein
MRHVDPDTLALLALGEHVAETADSDHLAQCEQCSQELNTLARAAAVGRSTLSAGELAKPSDRVWSRIVDELALTPESAPTPESASAPVVVLRPRRRWVPALIGAAAAIALVLGGVTAWQAFRPAPVSVLATATLDAFPDWPGSSGTATVEKQADGARIVQVSFEAPAPQDGYREVWLISTDTKRLVSLGVVRGVTGSFTIPDGVDISNYALVDISDEPYDGDPAHSGNSIVRGQLKEAA